MSKKSSWYRGSGKMMVLSLLMSVAIVGATAAMNSSAMQGQTFGQLSDFFKGPWWGEQTVATPPPATTQQVPNVMPRRLPAATSTETLGTERSANDALVIMPGDEPKAVGTTTRSFVGAPFTPPEEMHTGGATCSAAVQEAITNLENALAGLRGECASSNINTLGPRSCTARDGLDCLAPPVEGDGVCPGSQSCRQGNSGCYCS